MIRSQPKKRKRFNEEAFDYEKQQYRPETKERDIDICHVCHVSAYVDEGRVEQVPTKSAAFRENVGPMEYRFTCADCSRKV